MKGFGGAALNSAVTAPMRLLILRTDARYGGSVK